MKLAEALIERKGLVEKIVTLEERICGCATYQEGAEPPEDPNELLQELAEAHSNLGQLIMRINSTNARAVVTPSGVLTAAVTRPEGELLADLIVQRDLAIRHQNALKRIASQVRETLGGARGLRSELRMVTSVDLKQLEHQIDELGATARKLDAQIQAANWAIDLM